MVEHDDVVGMHHGGEPVGDDERRALARDPLERILDLLLVWLSSAEVASSSIRIGGDLRMVRAMATRCFSPPESFSLALADQRIVALRNRVMMKSSIWASRAASRTSASLAAGRP